MLLDLLNVLLTPVEDTSGDTEEESSEEISSITSYPTVTNRFRAAVKKVLIELGLYEESEEPGDK